VRGRGQRWVLAFRTAHPTPHASSPPSFCLCRCAHQAVFTPKAKAKEDAAGGAAALKKRPRSQKAKKFDQKKSAPARGVWRQGQGVRSHTEHINS